ncbi:MAG TPA: hypothetical protein VHX60_16585 [Acidobacteriaceae bacterium]|jgi:hypothetical protein|nr:hypothetical protein [Acidobacteriaceae bacterium]
MLNRNPASPELARTIPLRLFLTVIGLAGAAAILAASATAQNPSQDASAWQPGRTIVNPAVHSDRSQPLSALASLYKAPAAPSHHRPGATQSQPGEPSSVVPPAAISPEGAAVEQTTPGSRPPATQVAAFDGLGDGFSGPQGTMNARNPSDNSLGVGPNEIVQIVNSRLAIFSKQGKRHPQTGTTLFGPVITNTLFAGFGGPCENMISGDAVVRFDQLARRWLFVLPIFRRITDQPDAPYAMCYAVSVGPDPLGAYFRYQFNRPLFPDYPRPAIWPDGYYLPTSTGDTVIQKQLCAADRISMLHGKPAREQCVIVDGVNFLNASDMDGRRLPPAGAPNIVMAAGGTQLHDQFEADAISAWKFHLDWSDPANTTLTGPEKIPVAPYHYLCNGQLSKCVPQPNTEVRLDAQGDKLMQRLVYRNFGSYQSIVVSHSVDTKAGGGGVRWYEFRLDPAGTPSLYQQGTYAPDANFRWMPSIAMDRHGDIGVGYSFGGPHDFPGQRFAARLAADPKGQLTLREAVLADGQAAQTNTLRWEDYTTLDIDPADDCTFWYVGDYLRKDAASYSTRIGAFRLPGCAARHKW